MNIDRNKVQEAFEISVKKLKEEVDKHLKVNIQPGKIVPSTWVNQNNVVGSLSYFPTGNNADESIDFVLQLDTKTNIYSSDVSTSSGEILYQITERVIHTKTDDLISEILELTNLSSKNFFDWFIRQNWKNIGKSE